MVARKPTTKEGGKKKTAFTADKPKKPTSTKQSKPAPAKQPKHVKGKTSKPSPSKKSRKVDAKTGADMEKTNSEATTEIQDVGDEQGKDVSNMMALEERIVELDEGQVGLDLVKHPSLDLHQNVFSWKKTRLDQTLYKVHEILKHTTEEHVLIENSPSSTGTLSSMKNHDDAFTFGDQFINDKSTEEDPGKVYVETKVESMVTFPIHEASSLSPPLSTPVIDLSPPKPISSPVQEPVITATPQPDQQPFYYHQLHNYNTPKSGSQQNVFLGALLHNTIAQVMRERPLTVSFKK
ncbi:hypothetical protein Tco_0122920 [Tanacetum coccineum]